MNSVSVLSSSFSDTYTNSTCLFHTAILTEKTLGYFGICSISLPIGMVATCKYCIIVSISLLNPFACYLLLHECTLIS
jgi:hypothetical protein